MKIHSSTASSQQALCLAKSVAHVESLPVRDNDHFIDDPHVHCSGDSVLAHTLYQVFLCL